MLSDLPEGEPKKTIGDVEVKEMIKNKWASMSKEEQEAATNERIQEMEEDREVEALGKHTTENSSFHDVKATVEVVENQVSHSSASIGSFVLEDIDIGPKLVDLYTRTGTEVLAFVVRPDSKSFNQPYVLESSPRIGKYFHSTLGMLPSEFVVKLEGFCVSGQDGSYRRIFCRSLLTTRPTGVTHNTPAHELQELKSVCAAMIHEQLSTSYLFALFILPHSHVV